MEILLLGLAAFVALSALSGGIYVLMNPYHDYAESVLTSYRTFRARYSPQEFKRPPEVVYHIEDNMDNMDLWESIDIEETVFGDSSVDNLKPHSEESSTKMESYDPFQVMHPSNSLCEGVFEKCADIGTAHGANLTDRFLSNKIPVVVRAADSPVRSWASMYWNYWHWAYERWSFMKYVVELKDVVPGETSHVFSLSDTVHANKADPALTVHDELYLWDFLTGVRNKSVGCRYQKSNYMSMETEAELASDTDWKSWIMTDPRLPSNYSQVLVSPQLQFLYPGCALQAQYGEYHTVRIQMKGAARYILFPPEHSSKLHIFPYTHHKGKLSQLRLNELDSENEDHRKVKGIVPLSTELQPAEVLYIPPGWLVYTESVNLSVILDVYSPAAEQVQLLEATSTKLPFPDDLSSDERVIYTQVFLVHVLSRIDGINSIKSYSRKLMKSRYGTLYPENSLFIQQSRFSCFRDNEDYHNSVLNKIDKIKLQDFAAFIAKRFNDENVEKELRGLWLGNYIDSVLRWTYGPGHYGESTLFLKECLRLEGKIDVVEEVEGPPILTLDPKY